jgi:hypothetical protein
MSRALAALFISLALAGPATAVDFSGSWRLDVARSDFGKMTGITPPSVRTDVIRHRGPLLNDSLTQTRSGSTTTSTFDYVLDGQERVMKVSGQDAHYTGKWMGDTLQLDSKVRMMVFDIAVRERWSLTSDRRMLIIARHFWYPLGEGDQTLRFSRQAGPGSPTRR